MVSVDGPRISLYFIEQIGSVRVAVDVPRLPVIPHKQIVALFDFDRIASARDGRVIVGVLQQGSLTLRVDRFDDSPHVRLFWNARFRLRERMIENVRQSLPEIDRFVNGSFRILPQLV